MEKRKTQFQKHNNSHLAQAPCLKHQSPIKLEFNLDIDENQIENLVFSIDNNVKWEFPEEVLYLLDKNCGNFHLDLTKYASKLPIYLLEDSKLTIELQLKKEKSDNHWVTCYFTPTESNESSEKPQDTELSLWSYFHMETVLPVKENYYRIRHNFMVDYYIFFIKCGKCGLDCKCERKMREMTFYVNSHDRFTHSGFELNKVLPKLYPNDFKIKNKNIYYYPFYGRNSAGLHRLDRSFRLYLNENSTDDEIKVIALRRDLMIFRDGRVGQRYA